MPRTYRRAFKGQEQPSMSNNNVEDDHEDILEVEEGVGNMIRAFFNNDDINDQRSNINEMENNVSKEEKMLREQSMEMLFPGSTTSRLSACLLILDLQASYAWSDRSVTSLLKLLKTLLPVGNSIPTSRGEARKMLDAVGMRYETIHACPNDCCLYRNSHAFETHCYKCGAPRYRSDLQGTKTPQKVLRHMPIIPRIQHMYRVKSLAELMSWHATHRSTYDIIRIPADGKAWKHIESKWPEFKIEPRHLRLGLATDGVNPFGVQSTSWSTWPVIIVNYNIPPWLTIKKGHLILALIVPGKYKVKSLDVYMAPLIDELQILWRGVTINDVSRVRRSDQAFELKCILMWTMHDFPGLSECSGI